MPHWHCDARVGYSLLLGKQLVSLLSVSTEGGRFFLTMGTLLCRKTAFWRLLTMLFFLIMVIVGGVVSDEENDEKPECNKLTEESRNVHFLKCFNQQMMIKGDGKNYTKYPIADFSNFTQDEFDNLTEITDEHGTPNDPQPEKGRLFGGNLLIQSSSLNYIKLGFYIPIKLLSQSFVLVDNCNLTEIYITTPKIVDVPHVEKIEFQIIIRNNKRLSNDSLEALRSIEYYKRDISYIQQFGECTLNQNGLSTTEDLEDCHYTTNDLVITDKTVLTDTKALDLTEVDGCIRINGTNYTDLNVIRTIQTTNCSSSHEITSNGELCLHPEEIANLTNRIGKLVYKNNSKCLGRCTPTYLLDKNDSTCQIITGTLKISHKNESDNLSFLANIEEIWGRLQLHKNERSDLSILTLFPKLRLINGTAVKEDGDTVSVKHNQKLQNFTISASITIIHSNTSIYKAITVDQNGGFIFADEDIEELKKKLGKGAISIEEIATVPPQQFIKIKDNSTAEEPPKRVEKDEFSGWFWFGVIVGPLLVIVLLIGLIFVGCIYLRAMRKRKNLQQEQRIYEATMMTKLNVPELPNLISFPESITKPWIQEAYEILKNNNKDIAIQEKERLQRRAKNEFTYVQKNSNPVLPLYSRTDKKNKVFMHELKQRNVYDDECYDEPCLFKSTMVGGAKDPGKTHAICIGKCACKEEGIVVDGRRVFGVRMEKQFGKWAKNELEKSHQPIFQKVDVPITYEELSVSTMAMLEKDRQRFIDDERLFLIKEQIKQDSGINADTFDVKKYNKLVQDALAKEKWEETKEMMKNGNKKAAKKAKKKTTEKVVEGCVMKYNFRVFEYNPGLNALDDVTNFSINRKPATALRSFCDEFKPAKPTGCTHQILEDMIAAHMNCPPGQWLTNYTHDDIIELCQDVRRKLEGPDDEPSAKAYVEIEQINVRIVGEVRGRFDDLRKVLCLPSANSKEHHPILGNKHVFLGNYVGPYGQNMEIICLLFALKALFPDKYVLLRGVLEWRQMGDLSGLKVEVFTRFPEGALKVWDAINEVFDMMPLACKVGPNVLCTHAGVAPRMKELRILSLPITLLEPDTLPFNMMFAQPNWTVKRYFDNVEQKAGYYFGDEALQTAFKEFECDVLFCTKTLTTGFGVLGTLNRVFTLCSYQKKFLVALAEYDASGNLEFQLINITQRDKILYNDEQPYQLKADEKEQTKSRIYQFEKVDNNGKGSDKEKSTLSLVKAPGSQKDTSSQNPPSQNAPSKKAPAQAPSSGSKSKS